MSALVRHIALVSESKIIGSSDLLKVGAAIQKQATRDLAPIWEISATVDTFATVDDVPTGYWPVIIMDNIQQKPGVLGIHEDKIGQPFALVSSFHDIDVWSLSVSHEALEMLVDPWSKNVVAGDSLSDSQGRVNYLVEVCDPTESPEFAYRSNGILVADFYTPHFFDPVSSSGVRYSYKGNITQPRQVLRGGYLSWQDPETSLLWQQAWFDGDEPVINQIIPDDQMPTGSLRSIVDRFTMPYTLREISRGRRGARAAGRTPDILAKSTRAAASALRRQIQDLAGSDVADDGFDRSSRVYSIREAPIAHGVQRGSETSSPGSGGGEISQVITGLPVEIVVKISARDAG